MNKIFAVYKPKGPSSNQLLNKIRKIADTKKVGHAGTLDPLASGVLVVAIGRENTKKLRYILEEEKEYIGTVKLGETSETDDAEGEKRIMNYELRIRNDFDHEINDEITTDDIKQILPKFIGSSIWQMPPKYSAIKAGGKKAYEVARRGGSPLLGPRQVEIKEIEILNYKWPYLKIRVVCGSGTYIRSLARDIGEKLGTGAYLADLERTRVGDFNKKDAIKEEDLGEFLGMTK